MLKKASLCVLMVVLFFMVDKVGAINVTHLEGVKYEPLQFYFINSNSGENDSVDVLLNGNIYSSFKALPSNLQQQYRSDFLKIVDSQYCYINKTKGIDDGVLGTLAIGASSSDVVVDLGSKRLIVKPSSRSKWGSSRIVDKNQFISYIRGGSWVLDLSAERNKTAVITVAGHNACAYEFGMTTNVGHAYWTRANTLNWFRHHQTFALNVNETEYLASNPTEVDYHYIKMSGHKNTERGTYKIHSFIMNSPYLYLNNAPEGKVEVTLESKHPLYPDPDFTTHTTWNLQSNGTDIYKDGQKLDHLFYEFQSPSVTLSRQGKNFLNKAELMNYLESGDFFSRLGFDKVEKENSLNYIKEKGIPEADNYYLTLLSPEAIEEISTLAITPTPAEITRSYFAIYPTTTPVKTVGEIEFPEIPQASDTTYTARDLGEVVLKGGMVVMWE